MLKEIKTEVNLAALCVSINQVFDARLKQLRSEFIVRGFPTEYLAREEEILHLRTEINNGLAKATATRFFIPDNAEVSL